MIIHNWSRIVSILILISLLNTNHAKEVNSFNLLLPTSYHPIKGHARQIIITSGACYIWESTQNSIVKVKGTHHGLVPSQTANKNPSCHSNGIVELAHEGQYLSSVYITAQDKSSNDIISIPVRIRDLKKISIFTKSRIMNIKQVQSIQLYGFDSQDNTFTSLQGLKFKWIITQINERNYSTGAIQKIPLADSSLYIPLDTRKKLETQDKVQSDLLIIRALKVGKVNVKVRCLEPNYELISDQITLYIQQKFDISPALPVNLLVGSRFQYNLYTPTGFNIQLPSSNFDIHLSNPSFSIDKKLLIRAPRTESSTTLTVSDIRTSPPFSQSIEINVHQPDSIQIIVPEQIIIGQQIQYQIKFYYKKLLLKGQLDPSLLNIRIVQEIGKNKFILDKTNSKLKGISKGSAKFQVDYSGLTAEKTIVVTTPLKLLSKTKQLTLPVDQIYQLSVVGGSGLYKYSYTPRAQQQTVLTLSYNGLISTRRQGLAQVLITDEKNPNNKLQAKIFVRKLANLHSLQEYKQFNQKQQGTLYITGQPSKNTGSRDISEQFTQCNDALLKGISFINAGRSNSNSVPLHVINISPINHQSLNELHQISQSNKQFGRILKSRSTINSEQIYRQFDLYLQQNQINRVDLQKIILDMENYGLCAKLIIQPTSHFDGQVFITKHKNSADQNYSGQKLKVRVYGPLQNNIPDVGPNQKQLAITPLGSFKWVTKGGPYKWDNQQQVEVYLNGIKILPKLSKSHQDYLYPTIKCPRQQKLSYTIKYKNPTSSQLLRPVQQNQQIIIDCTLPDLLRIGLPSKSSKAQVNQGDFSNMRYILSSESNSTVYVLPGQCFRISLQPVFKSGSSSHQLAQHFYNASNVKYEFIGIRYGKIQQIAKNDQQNNVRVFTYTNKRTKQQDNDKIDTITITSYQLEDLAAHSTLKFPHPIKHTITVIPITPLQISSIAQKSGQNIIQLPNIPNSQYILSLSNQQIEDTKRFSVQCDQSILRCTKLSHNQIRIQPQNVQRTIISKIKLIDQYAIGNPQVEISVKVQNINGIDLWVGRVDLISNTKTDEVKGKYYNNINKNILKTKTWIFDGQQFVAIVDVYSISVSQGKTIRQSIKNIDPQIIQLSIDQLPKGNLKEIYRQYDPINKVVVILYKIPKVLQHIQKQLQEHIGFKLTASLRHRNNQILLSNPTYIEVHQSVSLAGTSGALPIQQFDINDGKRYLISKIDSYAYIMESCTTILDIQGGPTSIKTKIVSNPGQGYYFNVIKLNQRTYRVETLRYTQNDGRNKNSFTIEGKQKNLLTLLVYFQSEQSDSRNSIKQLVNIRCLILVDPIKDIRVQGNNKLLTNTHVRYLAQLGNQNQYHKVIKQQCSLKYKWILNAPSAKTQPILQITSDNSKLGVNISSIAPSNQDDVNSLIKNGEAELSVVVYSNKDRQIGRNSKKITVLAQQNVKIIPQSNVNYAKNQDLTINSDSILLIPSDSGLTLNNNIAIQQISPCDRSDSTLSVYNQNQLVTGSSGQYPELIKLQARSVNKLALPVYINVQVVDICTAVISNVNGAITVSPGKIQHHNLQLINFYFTDCLGRRFLHYNYKNIQYRVTVTDHNILSATIYNSNEGLISLEGHQIGQTELILQVIQNGIAKATDIVPVFVNNFIQPSQPLSVHIGDIVNFKGPQSSPEQKWSSSDTKVVKMNPKTGQTLANAVGQTNIRFGSMSTTLSVIKVVDLVKRYNKQQSKLNGYDYEIVYEGKRYPPHPENSIFVKEQLNWRCQVQGKQSSSLRAIATRIRQNNKQLIGCKVQKLPNSPTIQTPIKHITLQIVAQNKQVGFSFVKKFEQDIQFFVILSERAINTRDPKHKKEKNIKTIVIQTNQRLDYYQRGGKQQWIINSQFSAGKQIITIDMNHYSSGEWLIVLTNPRTKQTDQILISNKVKEQEGSESSSEGKKQGQKQGWKWTDILVIFMSINFLCILGYQILEKNGGGHAKTY